MRWTTRPRPPRRARVHPRRPRTPRPAGPWRPAPPRPAGSRTKGAADDLLGDGLHLLSPLHGRLLHEREGVGLLHAALVHEDALGPVEEAPRLELLLEVVDLGL